MNSARKNHLWKTFLIFRDEISEEESSLGEDFYPQGWNQPGKIILGREFLSAVMKSTRENHPRKRIFIRRDEISGEKSSLGEDFYPQGWNQQGWIISGREFLSAGMKSARENHLRKRILSAGMNSAGRNHPWERIFIRRDEISEGRIISGREFLSAGMNSAGKNHPWERIFIRRDEFSGEESSLEENFCRQGWIQRGGIIPGREFLSAGMNSLRMNHPWKIFLIRR